MLTKDTSLKVAKLSNLIIDDAEAEKYAKQLSSIVEYIEKIESVNTEGVEPLFNLSEDSSGFRWDDKPGECLTQVQALSNASKVSDQFFVTKGVFADE